EGHDDVTWSALLAAVRGAGYDGVVSIEHEDPRYEGPDGTERSAAGLGRALDRLARAAWPRCRRWRAAPASRSRRGPTASAARRWSPTAPARRWSARSPRPATTPMPSPAR